MPVLDRLPGGGNSNNKKKKYVVVCGNYTADIRDAIRACRQFSV